MRLILASTSPRRAEILREAGIPFEIRSAPNVDETPLPRETAAAMVARLAEAKARDVAASLGGDCGTAEGACIVLGADTTVELDGDILAKPDDAVHARAMLARLNGREHRVLTGVFLLCIPGGISRAAVETSKVTFAAIEPGDLEAYIASAEPFGKAGGYGIQGRAGKFIPKVEGCYFNVVGLPLAKVYALLRELGWTEPGQREK